MGRLHGLLEEDSDAALSELKPHVVTRSRHGSCRGFGVLLSSLPGFIDLAVESITSYLNDHKEKHIAHAVTAMRQDHTLVKNRLQQYSNDCLMYGRYIVEILESTASC